MIAELRPYSDMKNSDVEWLGEVPAHWEVERATRRLTVVKRPVDPNEISDQQVVHYSIPNVQQAGRGVLESGLSIESAKNLVDRTLLLVSKLNPRKGTIALAEPDRKFLTLASSEFVAMEPKHCAGKFARYLYESEHVRLELSSRVDSATKSHQRCSPEDILKLPIPWPPESEQTAIVRFLDHADRRIRRYINARQKLIALLKEQKQAIIHQAVTGQIDVRTDQPYSAYKPSDVEWLGEVPAHWEIARLKSSVANIVEHSAEFGQHDIYIALEHVESWTGQLKSSDQDTPPDSQLKRFESEDILFGKLRPYLAKVTRPTTGGLCVGEFLVLRSRCSKFDTGYVEQLLRSKPTIDAIDSSTFGAKMPRAEWGFIGGMEIVHPPLPEQHAIVRFLDRAAAKTDDAIARAQREINLLREYRTRLIADVVTGKLDVREAAAALPEADPLAADDEAEELLQTSEDPESGSEKKSAEFTS